MFDKPTIAEFLKYLTSPEVAGQWSVSTGYVPTSEAAANSEVYQKFLEEQPAGATALAFICLAITDLTKGLSQNTF